MSKFSRKDFLKRSVLATVSLPFVHLRTSGEVRMFHLPNTPISEKDEGFWGEVRNQYSLDERIINFNNGSVGPQPISVQDVHVDLYRFSNKAPAHNMWQEVDMKREQLREELAKLLDCETEELAINRNTTEGLNTIIFGLELKAGDEVVVSDFDYPFMLNAWKQRAERDGIVVKTVHLPLPIEQNDLAIELYRQAITPKTKVVHLTHVINWTGQIMPVKAITEMAHQNGCEVIVDAAHSLAQIPLSFKEIGCDYLATSLHKWLGAPFGTGALIIKREKISSVWPLLSAWEPKSSDIRKFELLGTRSVPAEMAVLDAIIFHRKLGVEHIRNRLHYLKLYWTEQVKNLNGIHFHTSLNSQFSGAMATISIDGFSAAEIAKLLLEKEGIDVGTVVWNGLDAVRISPHIYSSLQELDRLVDAIRKMVEK